MDPCLDDCVMLAKRLQSLNGRVGMDILPGLPHGFLNFVKVSKSSCLKAIVYNVSFVLLPAIQRSSRRQQSVRPAVVRIAQQERRLSVGRWFV